MAVWRCTVNNCRWTIEDNPNNPDPYFWHKVFHHLAEHARKGEVEPELAQHFLEMEKQFPLPEQKEVETVG